MFIHIGDNHVIKSKDIVTIIDRDVITSSSITEEMISNYQKTHEVIGEEDIAKSVVITTDHIYFSTLSIPTLKKRASMISTIRKLEDYSEELDLD